ncbi:MAG: hypothetical protein K2G36_06140, partial [Ruminococcus sp.]|nr:hypothetical protein [Ruminococcus sp.]
MENDGVNRIYVVGDEYSGRKTLIASLIYRLMVNAVSLDNVIWSLSGIEHNAEMTEKSYVIGENMIFSHKITENFDLKKIFASILHEVPDSINLEMKINNEYCGMVEFMNITGKSNINELWLTEISVILVTVDSEKLVENDRSHIENTLKKLSETMDFLTEKPRIMFAVTKADTLNERLKKDDFREFYRLFDENADLLVSYCMKNAMIYGKRAVSSANEFTEKVFDNYGMLLDEPDFDPWEVDKLFRDIICLSVPLMHDRLKNIIKQCNNT